MSIASTNCVSANSSPAVAGPCEALRLWLAWHDRERQLTELMFQSRNDPALLEQLRDDCDRLREQAVAASQLALAANPRPNR